MCNAEITLLDLETGENFWGEIDVQLSVNNITFSAAQLTPNRHYTISVRASNVIGTAISYLNISKHLNAGCHFLNALNLLNRYPQY